MKKIEIGTAISDKPGRVDGMLQVGWLPDASAVQIPVTIIRGNQDGPTVWMHGCVHGNEYCGAFIIHELLRGLENETELRGTVIALPALNITAFQRMQRMSPFEGYNGGDLNRCFPGKPGGTHTEQLAHRVYQELKQHATHFIDIHTAFSSDTRWALFAPPSGEAGKVAENMARAFGYEHTLPTPLDILVGSAMVEAAKEGIPGLILEAGGINSNFSLETVKDAASRLRNVFRSIGALPGKVDAPEKMVFFTNFAWVNATRGGLFQPAVKCGVSIKVGDVIGHYFDAHGNLLEEAKAPFDGIVLAIAGGPSMQNGEILVHVGQNPRPV
ncbi:succinylglutamate desuccinylase/aspartoacylase family protein [Ferrovibrio sp.]|uniref:succinylglutamate desuccinylase/aspartoacylase family protein n=1 Tax=Ferrovibrio sp. TaxID=1917215 RepID=UPI0035B457C1